MSDEERSGSGDLPEHQPDTPASNGAQGGYYANQIKAYLSREGGGGYFNVPKTFIEGSRDPFHYMARSEYTRADIGLRVRRIGDMNRTTMGFTNKPQLWAVKDTMLMSLGRKSRKEVVAIEAGRREMAQAANPGMMERMRDIHGGGTTSDKGGKP